MTSIDYGGGPTLKQRQEFCHINESGQIPGYNGFCPQMKFRYGHTFGRETALIADEIPYYNGPSSQQLHHLYPNISKDFIAESRSVFSDEVPGRMLPESTGDNKYFAGMIPGYSGDVPQMPFKLGATYRQTTNECVDDMIRRHYCEKKKREELREVSGLFPKLREISNDPRVRNHLNIWSDDMIRANSTASAVKGSTEAPIPGYQGHIPYMITETGLSKRYKRAAENSLDTFRSDVGQHFDRLKQPLTGIDTSLAYKPVVPRPASEKYLSSRIFQRDGMIPDYSGHIHGFQFNVGQNFGNTTRSLEVCRHPFPSYGDYVRERDLAKKYINPSLHSRD